MRFIGCKTLLLENIKQVIDEKAPDAKTFCDIFSGTSNLDFAIFYINNFFQFYYSIKCIKYIDINLFICYNILKFSKTK